MAPELSTRSNVLYRNLPNIVSVLGILPLFILMLDDGIAYLCALILFNNAMDDLDGILATRLKLCSGFGARLDNVCDAVAHILIVMVIGAHYGGVVLAACLVAAVAILIRIVQRLDPAPRSGTGTPTNELMRHILLVLVLHELTPFDVTAPLVAVLLLNAVSMLVPFAMPHLVRARTKSVLGVLLVNAALGLAWVVPMAAPVVAAAFFTTFFYSLAVGGQLWIRGR